MGKEFVDFDLFTTSGRSIDISSTCNKKNCVHQKVTALTIYKEVKAMLASVKNNQMRFDILPYLMRLRQISIDPKLYIENYKGGSSKLDMLSSLIPDYISKGHRILIFSQFVKALDEVDILLDKLSIPHFMLTGDTDVKKRMDMMLRFNEEDGPDVFLISLKAGGTGLNLTGADTVIHLAP